MVRQALAAAAAFTLLATLPWVLGALDLGFYLSLATRIAIYAIAATSLNLVLGYGGMVSLGHAAFFGLGAYTTGILVAEGSTNAAVHLLATLAVTGGAALAIGSVSLRTRGVYFIMITLAFAQMLYFFANSVKAYGGDEGLNIRARSAIGFGLDLKNGVVCYEVALGLLALVLVALARLVDSPLGHALRALRDDELRAEALGFPTQRIQQLFFTAGGALCGLAGALSVNLQGYVSPNTLHWTQSGTLLVMVILGGVGTLWGGAIGAAVLLLLEEVLAAYTPYWAFWTGWVLLAVVLFARGGVAGLLMRGAGR